MKDCEVFCVDEVKDIIAGRENALYYFGEPMLVIGYGKEVVSEGFLLGY